MTVISGIGWPANDPWNVTSNGPKPLTAVLPVPQIVLQAVWIPVTSRELTVADVAFPFRSKVPVVAPLMLTVWTSLTGETAEVVVPLLGVMETSAAPFCVLLTLIVSAFCFSDGVAVIKATSMFPSPAWKLIVNPFDCSVTNTSDGPILLRASRAVVIVAASAL